MDLKYIRHKIIDILKEESYEDIEFTLSFLDLLIDNIITTYKNRQTNKTNNSKKIYFKSIL